MESAADYKDLKYQIGFGNHFATECLPDALPKVFNNP
jgi:homogentisate 1,2-dioxygenase